MLKERGSLFGRLIDKYVGIALIFLLGLFTRKRPLNLNIKRIAIIRTAAIGDTVLLSAIIQDLYKSYPNSEIILFAGPSNIGITPMIPYLTETHLVQISNLWKAVKVIRKAGHFDVAIDTGQWPRLDALFTFLTKSKYRIGFATPNQFKHYTFHYAIDHSNNIHELDNFRKLIAPLVQQVQSLPTLIIPNEDFAFQGKPFIVFHPWPGGINAHLKEWPFDYWRDLANYIAPHGFHIIITGAKADVKSTQALINHLSPSLQITNLSGQLSLKQTTALLHKASALISVNTGIMHIGAAIDIPVIGLHGPTSSLRWGPIGKNAVAVSSTGAGCGYLNLGFEYAGNPIDCMQELKAIDVYKAFCQLLKLPIISTIS